MPERSSTDRPVKTKPSALETFTDRVSERELVERLMLPYEEGQTVEPADFLTVFYGVGGVGKTTLCKRVVETAREQHPEAAVIVLDLDSERWTPQSSFVHFLAVLVPELTRVKIPTPLTQALLLMYSQSQVDSGVQVEQGGGGLWNGAVAVLDEGAGAIGIPGIGLLIEGAQWLKDRQRQKETRTRLQELGLWPADDGGRTDSAELQNKMVDAFFEDVKEWAARGGNLRILLDGFERIQSRERKQDCQQLMQKLAGRFAAASDPSLKARVRLLIFGRERIRWDALYDDREWNDFWTQHLLAGLAEADARAFLDSHADWLRDHGDAAAAKVIGTHADAILDAADEKTGNERQIYPYYLDLAVDLVRQAVEDGRDPDLGGAPGELQDRFLRYLPENERRLMLILALAETFDSEMFDALVRDQRVAGYAVGTFLTSVVEGRSFVMAVPTGGYRFHRLMEDALQNLSLKSDAERQQAEEMVQWLLEHLEQRMGGRERKDWDESCIECWRRGVEIIVTQGAEREVMEYEEWSGLLKEDAWKLNNPATLESQIRFQERIVECLQRRLGPENLETLRSASRLGGLLTTLGNYEAAETLYRHALEGLERACGPEDRLTLGAVGDLGNLLKTKGDYEGAESLYRRELEGSVKAYGPKAPRTFGVIRDLGNLFETKGDYEGAKSLYRRAMDGYVKTFGPEDRRTVMSASPLADLLTTEGDYEGAESLYRGIVEGLEKLYGPEDALTLRSVRHLGNLCETKGDYEEAEVLYRRALEGSESVLESSEKFYGPKFFFILGSLESLGNLLETKGDYEGAESCFRRAEEGYEKALGRGHFATLMCVRRLADFFRVKGDYKAAELYYRRAVEELESSLGPANPETLNSVKGLANLLGEKGDYKGAAKLFRRWLSRPNSSVGLRRKCELEYNLARYECLEGDLEEAKRVLDVYLENYPEKKEQALVEEAFAAIHDWIAARNSGQVNVE